MNVPLFPTNYYFGLILGNIINPALAAPTLVAAAKLMAGTAQITPGLTTSYADLIEATFTGYAQSATIVWGTPINDVDTTPTSFAPSHLFRGTGVVENNIYNVAVTDGVAPVSTGILFSAVFAPAIEIVGIGDGFAVIVGFNLGNVPGNLSATIIN